MARSLLQQEEYEYLLVIQQYCFSPIVQRYYSRVALCTIRNAAHGELPFYVVEFRFRDNYALAWMDDRGRWVLGEWYKPNDYFSPVTLNMDYFNGNIALYSFGDLLDYVAESRPQD